MSQFYEVTGKGLPDISLLEPLAAALGVSILELVSGAPVLNQNKSPNMLRGSFYVCPVCGNLLHAAVVSCCGIALPPLTAEDADLAHQVALEPVEDETYLTLDHPMTKAHYGITAQLCLRPSPNLLPHPCSYKRGKYIRLSKNPLKTFEIEQRGMCARG